MLLYIYKVQQSHSMHAFPLQSYIPSQISSGTFSGTGQTTDKREIQGEVGLKLPAPSAPRPYIPNDDTRWSYEVLFY